MEYRKTVIALQHHTLIPGQIVTQESTVFFIRRYFVLQDLC